MCGAGLVDEHHKDLNRSLCCFFAVTFSDALLLRMHFLREAA